MTETYYRIKATAGEHKGKFSSGRPYPTFVPVGKIWAKRNHVMSHINDLTSNRKEYYAKAKAIVEEIEVNPNASLSIVEALELTNFDLLMHSLESYFINGEVSSDTIKAIVTNNVGLYRERMNLHNRKNKIHDISSIREKLPHHCLDENFEQWVRHQGFTNCPDATKAMMTLEYTGSGEIVERWIK